MTTPAAAATATVADYVLAVRPEDLPDTVRREGLRSFVNIVGCTVGGARHEAIDTAWRGLATFAGEKQASLLGRGAKTDALTACLINTLSSSIYTYDDTHARAIVHPAGPVMAAVLAVAERQPVTGRELLTAFTLGIEMMCRLSMAVSVAPAKGKIAWSQTGITGGIGAAIAAAKLLRLDAQGMRRAIGIAASSATGLRAAHGTMCTAMAPAHAGHDGLRAAYLAQAGFTCNETTLEHRYGFAACFAEEPHLAHLTDGLGSRFESLGNTYKPFPCGIVIHPMIDGALALKAEHTLDAADIEHVALKAAPAALALCDRPSPKDEFEGQVSLYHWMSAAFVRGKAGIPEGQDAAIRDPALSAFRARISAKADPAIANDAVDIAVTLKNGRVLEKQVRDCIGSKGRPMTDHELNEKFESQSEAIIGSDRTRQLLAECWRLEYLPDVAALVRLAA